MASNDKGLEEIPEGMFKRHFLSVLVGCGVTHCRLQTFCGVACNRKIQQKIQD
jgi:hypothetical protein